MNHKITHWHTVVFFLFLRTMPSAFSLLLYYFFSHLPTLVLLDTKKRINRKEKERERERSYFVFLPHSHRKGVILKESHYGLR